LEGIVSKREHDVLVSAAEAGLRAPSVFNTQPWQWRIDAASLDLYADPDRMLAATDPQGRLMLLSCGAALHHARVALAAAGWRAVVDRFPDPADGDFLARIRLSQRRDATDRDLALYRAIAVRRTDRRPFGDRPVAEESMRELLDAAECEGVRIHDTRPDQMPMLAVAVAAAQSREFADRRYRSELMRWTNRPSWSNDGVPQSTGVAQVARRVPVRDFVQPPNKGMPVKPGGDRTARYLIVSGAADEPIDWVRAGEGASAVLLTAVSLGLAVAPISDVIEVERSRQLVRGLLPGAGCPYLVIRCGHAEDTTPIDPAPRRDAAEAIKGSRP
jgi:hypothetical protein